MAPATPPAPKPSDSKSLRRRILRIAFAVLAALLLILVIDALRPLPPNPPERYAGVIVDEATDAMLRRACFDCHSNETRWPWFTRLPGVASLTRWDVLKGRDELNFSAWGRMSPRKRAKALRYRNGNKKFRRRGQFLVWPSLCVIWCFGRDLTENH